MARPLEICRVSIFPLDVPLAASFNTATSDLSVIHNLAVAIELADSSTGWGETPVLPHVTTEDQATARMLLEREAALLQGRDARQWRTIACELSERLPDHAAVLCGLEMALVDALAKSWRIPLFRFFGGVSDEVVTDITIPICPAEVGERLARQYRTDGFETIKAKVGRDAASDIARILAIRRGHPDCRLVLDANTGYTVDETLFVLAELRKADIVPVLLEQPVPREDWDGLGRLAREAGVPIAADESCRTPQDAIRIAGDRLAQVINIKLAKCGVIQALDIAAIARGGGLGLMIGGMVETRIAMGFSAHFAAGLGGFDWMDLDTPLLLARDPVTGGYVAEGPRYRLDVGSAGHGGELLNW